MCGQSQRKMCFPNAGRPQKADVVSLLHPSHITQPEHLLASYAALKPKVKSIKRLFCGKGSSFAPQQILLFNTEPLFLCKKQFHTFQGCKIVFSGVQGLEINWLDAQVRQKVQHSFLWRQHHRTPTFA